MTMMISKFHKLIQSKILWGIFAVVISISFVGLFTQMPKGKTLAMSKVSPGKLNGKYVHPDEFYQAQNQTRLAYAINFGRWPSVPEGMENMVRDEAWRRLITLRQVGDLGLTAGDTEVVAAIQREPSFAAQGGGFDANTYRAFVNNVLYRGLGISEKQFEAHLQQQLSISKLRNMVDQTLLVTPEEVLRTYHTVTDVFALDYALIEAAAVTNEVEVTDEYARGYFEDHDKDFTTEPMVKVKYVTFPIQEFAEKVEISDEDAKAYYDENIDSYTTFSEVEPKTELTEENAATETPPPTPVVQAFDEVREDIIRKLQYREAEIRAGRQATEFVVAVQRNAESGKPDFDRLANDINRPVKLTGAFSVSDTLDEVDAGTAFAEAAFERDLSPDDYFSDPIVGETALYVLGLVEQIAPRIPAYEAVEDDVRVAARAEAIRETLSKKADELKTAITEGLAKGTPFADIVTALGYKTDRVEDVTAMEGLSSAPNGDVLMQAVLSRNEGELTDPLPVPNGIMLAYVGQRRSSAGMQLSEVQGQIVQSIKRERTPRAFTTFQKDLLERASFEDLQPVMTPEEEEGVVSPDDSPAAT